MLPNVWLKFILQPWKAAVWWTGADDAVSRKKSCFFCWNNQLISVHFKIRTGSLLIRIQWEKEVTLKMKECSVVVLLFVHESCDAPPTLADASLVSKSNISEINKWALIRIREDSPDKQTNKQSLCVSPSKATPQNLILMQNRQRQNSLHSC